MRTTMQYDQSKVIHQLEQLSLEEKVSLLAGIGFATTAGVPRLGINSMRLAEGVNGVKDAMMIDSGDSVGDVLAGKGPKTVCFPSTSCFAATWNSELMFELGGILAQQAREKGISTIMGPGVNLHRDPRGGRNFEYFSEDPLLTGQLAAAMINGIQQNGVGACLKHFFANEAEDYRRSYNVTDPSGGRAFRELYLASFQETLRHSNPVAVMTSYNKVDGLHTSQTPAINDILRGEWKYDGAVQSDWFGTASVVESILVGQDLEMPGPSIWRGPRLLAAIKEGKVSEAQITERALKMLEWIDKVTPKVPHSPATEAEQMKAVQVSRRVASEGTVLLQNKNSVLPLDTTKPIKIAVIGQHAMNPPVGGGGSSLAPPSSIKTPLDYLRKIHASPDLVRFSEGVSTNKLLPLLPLELISNEERKHAIDVSYYNNESNQVVFHETLSAAQVMMLGHVKPGLEESGFRYEMATNLTPDIDGEHTVGVRSTGQFTLTIDGNEVLSASATVCNAEDLLFAPYSLEKSCTYPMRKGRSYAIRLTVRDQRSTKIKPFEPGAYSSALCFQREHPSAKAIAEAAALASESDVAIVFAGRNAEHESEGFDQPDIKLPRNQTEMVQAVAAASKKTVLVLFGGGAFDISSVIDAVDAIIYVHYPGQEAGEVIADIISGKVNPSGKLANTWPRRLEDVASYNHFPALKHPDGTIELPLVEEMEVGYRRDWSQVADGPRYWFGYGLSYTTFSFSDLSVHFDEAAGLDTDSKFAVNVSVTNTGPLAGSEVVQVYVAPARSSHINGKSVSAATMHPGKVLKGFRKVALEPSESINVELVLEIRSMLSFWNIETSRWNIRKGVYTVSVGSCYDARDLSQNITVDKDLEWSGL